MQKTVSRRALLRQVAAERLLCQEVLKTLAAILIDYGGPMTVRRENLLLATELRVDCRPNAEGHQVLRLQDQSGRDVHAVDQSVHHDADRSTHDPSDVAGEGEALHGI